MTKLNPDETKYGQMAQNLRESMPDTANVPGSLAYRAIELLDQRHLELLAERAAKPKTLIEQSIELMDAALYPADPRAFTLDAITITREQAVRILLGLKRAKESAGEQADERS